MTLLQIGVNAERATGMINIKKISAHFIATLGPSYSRWTTITPFRSGFSIQTKWWGGTVSLKNDIVC